MNMSEAEQVLSLVGDIYDAALEPGRWRDVLERTASFVGGAGAALVSLDVVSLTGHFVYTWGFDPHYVKLYLNEYIKLNPARCPILFIKVGEVRSISNLVPFDEFQQTRLHQEWVKPQGWGDATIGMLDKSPSTAAHLTIAHHDWDSPASEESRRRVALIVPHMRRAVLIAKMIEVHKSEASSLMDAVDAMAAGVFLVSSEARVVHANASAREMLEAGDTLRAIDNRLDAAELEARATLLDAITRATAGDFALGVHGVAIPLSSLVGERYIAHVLPLTTGRRRNSGAGESVAVGVFVQKATLKGPTPIQAIAQHFHLTPGELRVLVAIVEVGGVPEVAPVLGISEATVKAHLRSVFDKTGAKRQADLIKLFAGYANPLLDRSEQPA
jgi:DNA-binding CsgD family transcriptional regulator